MILPATRHNTTVSSSKCTKAMVISYFQEADRGEEGEEAEAEGEVGAEEEAGEVMVMVVPATQSISPFELQAEQKCYQI